MLLSLLQQRRWEKQRVPGGFPSHPLAPLTRHGGWCHPGHHGAPGPASEPISVGAGSAELAARGIAVPAAIGGTAAGCRPPSRVRTSASARRGERGRVLGSRGWESRGLLRDQHSSRTERALLSPEAETLSFVPRESTGSALPGLEAQFLPTVLETRGGQNQLVATARPAALSPTMGSWMSPQCHPQRGQAPTVPRY